MKERGAAFAHVRARVAVAGSGARTLAACTALLFGTRYFEACTPPTVPVCNGHAELCDRSFSDVAFAGSHNAMSNIHDDFAAPNQRETMSEQLALGVRAFLIDTHLDANGNAGLCHESCAIGETPLADGLAVFKQFLDDHPHDVVVLAVEDYVGADQFAAAMSASGLINNVIEHDPGAPWPTLGALGGGVYIVTEHSGVPPAWYQTMYLEYVDTPFSFHTKGAIDADASCDKNRGSDDNALLLVNHWVEDPIPDEAVSADVNAHDELIARARRCMEARRHRTANIVAVDYVSAGDLLRVVDELNGF